TGVEREKLAERMRSLRSIRLEAEGEKPNSARGKTSGVEKKVKHNARPPEQSAYPVEILHPLPTNRGMT
ncbi:hypothetical protein, partial [Treponema sp. R80B11-R83G3]